MEREKKTPENLGASYLAAMTASRPLTPQDEEAIVHLLKRRSQEAERKNNPRAL